MWRKTQEAKIMVLGLKTVSKLVPKSKGLVQNAITGIGFHQAAIVVDNLIGSPLQRFGFSLPFVGRLSVIDIANFVIHNNGKIMPSKKSTNAIVAVLASRVVRTGQINIPSAFGTAGLNSATATQGPTGGGL